MRRSYREPVETFDVNVRGTLVLLQALRDAGHTRACLVVTSDKVYENNDLGRRFVETDPLGGADPYSASKAACEIATASFSRSFCQAPDTMQVSTARAGNVIGGGDDAEDRIIPDIVRARRRGEAVALRYPEATRPWQHALDPVAGYLLFLEAMAKGGAPKALNFGPLDDDNVSVRQITELFHESAGGGSHAPWQLAPGDHPHEARLLSIDAGKARDVLGFVPRLSQREAVRWTAEWYSAQDRGEDMTAFTSAQLERYLQSHTDPSQPTK